MKPITLCLLLLVALVATTKGQANKKKFGGSSGGSKDKDYEAPAASDSDYEGQDESYYEDYEGEKSSASPKTTEKPKATSPSSHDKDGKGGPSLFGPRRTRKPFSPKPVERARATLPSFIRHPANPADLTTFRPTARPSVAPTTKAPSGSGTTKSSVSVIRATTARSNRYKNNERPRTNTDSAASNDANRRFGGTTVRSNNKNRSNFRQNNGN